MDSIRIIGARQHNLKNIDLEIPRGKFVVITGVSGSGKSSLAFDTIFAEGERRYMESLSAYARQFVEKIDKPDVDSIEGLSPSVSVDQRTFQRNPRSTVGTITEIYDFLRLFFARLGRPHCPGCGKEISPQSIESMVERVLPLGEGEKVSIFSPIVQGRKGEYRKEIEELRRQGFLKVRVDGKLFDLDDEIHLEKQKKHTIELLVDVIALGSKSTRQIREKNIRTRIEDSLKLALKRGGGVAKVETGVSSTGSLQGGKAIIFSEKFACPDCGISYPEISPRLFSFNSPYGSCHECQGLGTKSFFDPELIIEPEKTIEEGAIIPWRSSRYFQRVIEGVARHYKFSLDTPFKRLPAKIRKIILYGSGNEEIKFYRERKSWANEYSDTFPGVIGVISEWYDETESDDVREAFEKYKRTVTCPACGGSRLKKESLSVLVANRSIYDIAKMSVNECIEFFKNLELTGRQKEIGEKIVKEIDSRLSFLKDVGLGYLSFDRSAPTLSGGEAQRIRLATQVGSKLTGVTYVLDEPTIGLHPRDNQKLIQTLKALRDGGNTILVVEHDEETMRNADFIVDLGPGAGEKGGDVVATGKVFDLVKDERSLTGKYLSGQLFIPRPGERRKPKGFIKVEGASENNLKDVDASFPLGVFTCVTGVSGSGKSTLVIDTLYNALSANLYKSKGKPGRHKKIIGEDEIDKVLNVDQSPIGRTPRSNPATYTGVFTPIRELFSMLPEARMRGYKPGRFSFNVEDGRCSGCKGEGAVKIEMHFLPDVYVTCEQCGGSRYNSETLEVKYKGKNIADVLNMTVSEALGFFENVPHVKSKLRVLHSVGLDYIKLGQPATTLSGGEAQRIKLSKELSRRATGRTLYILDEPTIGLHFDDVRKLIEVLQRLVDMGNTIIVIEHNLDVIKSADYVIDLGPEGGEQGGWVVACGTPEEVSQVEGSYTGIFLRKVLN
ncbi:MAG TPA: excinuclease ABC subunit UvrA [Thermodesulfobacteriota bacterium]|nr:excinuclease ABC subunit UvrA [Thermodesulfobacteriota bacterium]